MSSRQEGSSGTYVAGAALIQFRRVKIDSAGQVVYAGAGEAHDAVTMEPAASGDPVGVRFNGAPGTFTMTADGAITRGASFYGAASGKISATSVGPVLGKAIEAAAADNDEIEVIPIPDSHASLRTVEAHTADDTLTVAESGSVHTTVGAGGAVTFTMPPAVVGLEYFFYVGAAQELRIDPDGTETISLPSTGVPGAAGKYLTANAAGESVHLVCAVAGSWAVYGNTGTWTAEV